MVETITIKAIPGRKDFSREVVHRSGVWVVHADEAGRAFVVTHAPSTHAIAFGQTRRQAIAVADYLAANGWAEWAKDGLQGKAPIELKEARDAAIAASIRRVTSMAELLSFASPGAWVAHTEETAGEGWPVASMGYDQLTSADWGVEVRGVHCSEMDGQASFDAQLVAALRNRVPVLLEELGQLLDGLDAGPAQALTTILRRFEEGPDA